MANVWSLVDTGTSVDKFIQYKQQLFNKVYLYK